MRFYLTRIRINRGGYDSSGYYWGKGGPLYRFESEDGEHYDYIRAVDRNDARDIVSGRYPNATFFN